MSLPPTAHAVMEDMTSVGKVNGSGTDPSYSETETYEVLK